VYFVLLLATTLAAGLILHALASLLSLAIWRLSRTWLNRTSPRFAATLLLAMRMSPLLLSLSILAIFVIPSFLEFEPRTTIEPLSFTLLSLAALTAISLSGSLVRCIFAILQSRKVMREWLRQSQLQQERVEGVAVYRCDLEKPVIAVMGLWSARIFASDSVFTALTEEEIHAAFRHEAVHAHSFDVAKKMFLQLAPSFLPGIDLLKSITSHWSRVCELSADECAVSGDSQRTLHLASALVKVARLAGSAPDGLPALSAALQGGESFLGHRIRRLLEISENPETIATDSSVDFRKVLLAAASITALLLLAYPQVLSFTHELLEFLVQG
jgi:Zn-dependent protease with chaperone function